MLAKEFPLMLRSSKSLVFLALTLGMLLSACAKTENTTTDATSAASPIASDAPSPLAETSTAPIAAPATIATAVPASPVATQDVKYTDIKGTFGEKAITQLASLGVFGDASGTFGAAKPILRRDFVRWLFRANNAIWAIDDTKLVHPAPGSDSSFIDVKPSDPDFQYIEGMQDSGISVGFPDKTFEPDRPITREQALAIKAVLDRGGVEANYVISKKDPDFGYYVLPAWKDKKTISPEYVGAIATSVNDDKGATNEGDLFTQNVERTFGAIAALKPKQALTRGEAALMLTRIGPHVRKTQLKPVRTAIDALQPVLASPTP